MVGASTDTKKGGLMEQNIPISISFVIDDVEVEVTIEIEPPPLRG